MCVSIDLSSYRLMLLFDLPNLGRRNEETLIGSEAVDLHGVLSLLSEFEGVLSHASSTQLTSFFSSPPVFEISVFIVRRTLVVETVGHFVSDHHSDAAVVYRVVGVFVEERELQNARGKNNFIIGWMVIGIDGLGSHAPF